MNLNSPQRSPLGTPGATPVPTPLATAPNTVVATPVAYSEHTEPLKNNWQVIDAAMNTIQTFDAIELSSLIVDRAIARGPKDVFNEAGSARFKLAKLKQQYAILRQSLCASSLEAKHAQIDALVESNRKKKNLAGIDVEGEPPAN